MKDRMIQYSNWSTKLAVALLFGVSGDFLALNATVAQDLSDEAAMKIVQECVETYQTRYKPLEEKSNDQFMDYSRTAGVENSVIRELHQRDDETMKRVTEEIERLENQLDVYKRVFAAIEAEKMDPGAVDTELKKCNDRIAELEKQRKADREAIYAEMGKVRDEYKEEGKLLTSLIPLFAKPAGDTEATEGLALSDRPYSNYAQSNMNTYYKEGDDTRISLTFRLFHLSKPYGDRGKLNDKYTYLSKNDTNFMINVGNWQVSCSGRGDVYKGDRLIQAFTDLVDLEKLEKINPLTEEAK